MRHVVMFSGGIGSWGAAKRVVERHGASALSLLFTDTLLEDTDLYRFLIEGACDVAGEPIPTALVHTAASLPEFHEDERARIEGLADLRADTARALPWLVWLAEGRDPWTVFFAERLLGNSRRDPCSKKLKREPADRWFSTTCRPEGTAIYVGIDWTEEHRYIALAARRLATGGWSYHAPLCESPWVMKGDLFRELGARGIRRPRLYTLGLSHNNCGGGCIKAGQGHWAHVLRDLPAVFAWWEAKEQAIRAYLGKDVSMLRHRGGPKEGQSLTLRELRLSLEAGGQVDMFEIGGCGCFGDDDESEVCAA